MNGNRFICVLYKFFVSNDSSFLITHKTAHTHYIWLHPQWFFHYIFFCFSSFAVQCVFRTERQLMLDCYGYWYCCRCYCWCCYSLLLLLLLLFVSFGVFFLSAIKKNSSPNHWQRQRRRKRVYIQIHIDCDDCTDRNSANTGRFVRLYVCRTWKKWRTGRERKNKEEKTNPTIHRLKPTTIPFVARGGYWIFFFSRFVHFFLPHSRYSLLHLFHTVISTLACFILNNHNDIRSIHHIAKGTLAEAFRFGP